MAESLSVFAEDWDEVHAEPGFAAKRLRLGRRLGGELLGASVYELPPGQRGFPLHFHHANEELLVVLAGTVSVRTAAGDRELGEGDALIFVRGPRGVHQMINRSGEPARVLVVSTMHAPDVAEYPDSGKIGVFAQPPGSGRRDELKRFLRGDATAGYLEGEPTGP
jgi:uncharacterized cupin superfamily protein